MNVVDNILSIITFLPLVGAALLLFVPANDEIGKDLARWIALATSVIVLVL